MVRSIIVSTSTNYRERVNWYWLIFYSKVFHRAILAWIQHRYYEFEKVKPLLNESKISWLQDNIGLMKHEENLKINLEFLVKRLYFLKASCFLPMIKLVPFGYFIVEHPWSHLPWGAKSGPLVMWNVLKSTINVLMVHSTLKYVKP